MSHKASLLPELIEQNCSQCKAMVLFLNIATVWKVMAEVATYLWLGKQRWQCHPGHKVLAGAQCYSVQVTLSAIFSASANFAFYFLTCLVYFSQFPKKIKVYMARLCVFLLSSTFWNPIHPLVLDYTDKVARAFGISVGSLTEDILFEELVTMNRPCLPYQALYAGAWPACTLAWAATARESAGVLNASLCCALVGVITRVIVQTVRRRYAWVCLLCKLKGTMAWEGGRGFPQMGSAQCAMGKSIWGLSHAICKPDSQHLKGCKIYSLSVFLFFILLY